MKSQPPPQPPRPSGPSTPRPAPGPSRAVGVEILYPVTELAKLWRCSADHIYRLIADGDLAAVQISKGRAKTRVPESSAAEYVAKQLRPTRRAA